MLQRPQCERDRLGYNKEPRGFWSPRGVGREIWGKTYQNQRISSETICLHSNTLDTRNFAGVHDGIADATKRSSNIESQHELA